MTKSQPSAPGRKSFEKRYETSSRSISALLFRLKPLSAGLRAYPTRTPRLMAPIGPLPGSQYRHEAVALDLVPVVPVIRTARRKKSPSASIANLNDLAERARSKKLSPRKCRKHLFPSPIPASFGGLFGLPVIRSASPTSFWARAIEKRPW